MKYQVFLYLLFICSFSYSMDYTIPTLTTLSTTVQTNVLTPNSVEVQTRLAQGKKIVNAEKEKVDSSGQRFKQVRRMG
jgi:nitrate reductase NapAB chaperone NapD